MKRSVTIAEQCTNECCKTKIARLEAKLERYETIMDSCHIDLGLCNDSNDDDSVAFCNGEWCGQELFEGDGFECDTCTETYCEKCVKDYFIVDNTMCRRCGSNDTKSVNSNNNDKTVTTTTSSSSSDDDNDDNNNIKNVL